jgi:hypothetical protein
VHISYENLVARPEETIRGLNRHLETNLAIADLAGVYQGSLHHYPRKSAVDCAKAALIYFKNRSERPDASEGREFASGGRLKASRYGT